MSQGILSTIVGCSNQLSKKLSARYLFLATHFKNTQNVKHSQLIGNLSRIFYCKMSPETVKGCIPVVNIIISAFTKPNRQRQRERQGTNELNEQYNGSGVRYNSSSHAPLRNLKFYLLPDSSTSIVFRTRAIVSVVYSIVFSANPVKPYERCVAPQ